jgi:hypothetical protein
MKIYGVVEINDNGEFVTLVLDTGSAVHLPVGEHSIVVHTGPLESGAWGIKDVTIDFHV